MKRIGLALVALSVAVAPSVLSENPPATCIGTETFRMQVQGSINGGQTWNSNSVSVYGYPSTQINLPIRTLMTITTGQTQGWSFSLEPDPTYLSITAVTTNGTNTATVKAGDPPDQNTTAIRSNGLAQGIVIDTSTGITLNPTTDFVRVQILSNHHVVPS